MQHTQHDMDVISACVSAREEPEECQALAEFHRDSQANIWQWNAYCNAGVFYADALLGNGLTERAGKMYAYYGYPQHARACMHNPMPNKITQVYTVFVDTLAIGFIRKNGSKCYDNPTRASVRRVSFLLDILTYRGFAKPSVNLRVRFAPTVQWYFD